MFQFVDATKEKAKARIALIGPAGSGKTYTALTIAKEFGGPIVLIDTERGSASKYSGATGFKFKTLQLNSFDPLKFPELMRAAAEACHGGTIIIDSYSSWWNGAGGMIEYVDKLAQASRAGNSFQAWGKAKPAEKAMIDSMLAVPCHVIVTMRAKTEYIMEEDERGKKTPKKVGLAPEQRSGCEYEFDIVGDMTIENTLLVSKSRCSEIRDAQVFKRPNGRFAKMVLDWLNDGVEPTAKPVDTLAFDMLQSHISAGMLDGFPAMVHQARDEGAITEEQVTELRKAYVAAKQAAA